MKNKVVGVLVVVIALAVVGVLVVRPMLNRKPPKLGGAVSVPKDTTLGATIEMVVTVSNPHTAPQRLHSIDIDDSFLQGFRVVNVDPKPANWLHVVRAGQRSWWFKETVPAARSGRKAAEREGAAPADADAKGAGTLAVTFQLEAVQAGHFNGDVDVCTAEQDIATVIVDVVVNPKTSD